MVFVPVFFLLPRNPRLLDRSLQLSHGFSDQLLLEGGQLAQSKVLLDAALPQKKRCGEVLALCLLRPDIPTFHHTLLSIHGVQDGEGEAGSSISHGQGSRTGSSLGLHHLSAGLLDPGCQSSELVSRELDLWCALGDEGNDGLPSMTSNDWYVDTSWVKTFELCHEGVGSDNVQGCDTKHSVGVVNSMFLHDL
ncbi:hypothetical protein F7725_018787 [Dissostichus mawsoni]|uniref:Uncharacterized protein n=1 Tax=Dissostichus mawsoni TaxID=36200 RepID=A0A7J5XSJ9_DISMA|nr:hypothetical protein F7725_018787 [Dissostichus mawsoni]